MNPDAATCLLDALCAQPLMPVTSVSRCRLPDNDECFRFVDERTGKPLPNERYRITCPSGIFEGRTDQDGRTQRVYTGQRIERLTVERLLDDADVPEEGPVEVTCP